MERQALTAIIGLIAPECHQQDAQEEKKDRKQCPTSRNHKAGEYRG